MLSGDDAPMIKVSGPGHRRSRRAAALDRGDGTGGRRETCPNVIDSLDGWRTLRETAPGRRRRCSRIPDFGA
jgi:hypothetical protein